MCVLKRAQQTSGWPNRTTDRIAVPLKEPRRCQTCWLQPKSIAPLSPDLSSPRLQTPTVGPFLSDHLSPPPFHQDTEDGFQFLCCVCHPGKLLPGDPECLAPPAIVFTIAKAFAWGWPIQEQVIQCIMWLLMYFLHWSKFSQCFLFLSLSWGNNNDIIKCHLRIAAHVHIITTTDVTGTFLQQREMFFLRIRFPRHFEPLLIIQISF